MKPRVTLSVIKADVGGFVGHSHMHPDLLAAARTAGDRQAARAAVRLSRDVVRRRRRPDHDPRPGRRQRGDPQLAWEVFEHGTEVAKKLKLYGAGQDLLADAFSRERAGHGPGVAEMEIRGAQRPSRSIVFLADKTEPGAWNLPLYKMFADPFNTIGLVIRPEHARRVSVSRCTTCTSDKTIIFDYPGRDVRPAGLHRRAGPISWSSTSTARPPARSAPSPPPSGCALIAGKYVGKDDPVMHRALPGRISRRGRGAGAVHHSRTSSQGWMRGSHHGPLMPVPVRRRAPQPLRRAAAGDRPGLPDGQRPADRAARHVRRPVVRRGTPQANVIADYLRRHGPFEPHRLPMEEMEYTTMPEVMAKLAGRWVTEESHKKVKVR